MEGWFSLKQNKGMFDSVGAGVRLEQIINCSSNGKGGIKVGLFYSMEPYISSNA